MQGTKLMFPAGVDFENFTKISVHSNYLSKIRVVLAFKTLQATADFTFSLSHTIIRI